MSAFKEYFRFNKAERVGILVLLSLIFISIILPVLFSFIIPEEKIDELLLNKKIYVLFKKDTDKKQLSIDSLFTFNPNQLAVKSWKKLGLRDYQIRVIKNFESKGGRFNKKDDLKKIYSIKEADYTRLEPYICIQSTKQTKQQTPKQLIVIELNAADSLQLISLVGIGPAYAYRIMKYRKLLGGFRAKEQLLEVYGFNQARFNTIQAAIIVDTTKIKKLNINDITFKELMRHPYVGYENAKRIMTYKKQEGTIAKLSELLTSGVLSASIYHKLSPYIVLK